MKARVAVLTACVLTILLLVFDTFIYSNLYHHLLNVERAAVSAKVQAIAQYSPDNRNDNSQPKAASKVANSPYIWLRRFAKPGQTIVIVDEKGHVLAKYGHAQTALMVTAYQKLRDSQPPNVSSLQSGALFDFAQLQDGDSVNANHAYVLLRSNVSSIQSYMNSLLMLLVIGSIGAIVLAALGGYLISAIAVRPMNQMIRLVERIQVHSLGERVSVPPTRDEVGRLASTFNSMLNRMERSFQQQSRFVADASHEIRTPLTTIQGYANLLARWGKEKPDVLDKGIRVIQKEANRMRSLTEDLLTLASLDIAVEDMPKRANTTEVIEEVVDAASFLHDHATIQTHFHAQDFAAMSPMHLKQIISNLVDNAMKYAKPDASIAISTYRNQDQITIEIKDNGQGIPEEDLPHVFERFYRVDKSRARREGGSGLGLSIVKELVEAYGGTIRVNSTVGVGTTATVTVPAV